MLLLVMTFGCGGARLPCPSLLLVLLPLLDRFWSSLDEEEADKCLPLLGFDGDTSADPESSANTSSKFRSSPAPWSIVSSFGRSAFSVLSSDYFENKQWNTLTLLSFWSSGVLVRRSSLTPLSATAWVEHSRQDVCHVPETKPKKQKACLQ